MKKTFFLALALSVLWVKIYAQDEMFKALFMYNFTKDIEWPADYKSGDFVITVIGSNAMFAELEKVAAKKKVGSQSIVVKKAGSADEISKSNIVYISESKSNLLEPVNTALAGKPTVVITDKPGLATQGAAINYVKIDGKQKFEINPGIFTKQGLKVNSFLTSLGIVVK